MKILAAGCSFTSGCELPDCLGIYGISKYAYPSILGKIYNAEVNNISLIGGSNTRIFRLIIDELCKNSYELVICGWTSHDRLDLQYNNKDIPSTVGCHDIEHFSWLKHYYADHHSYYQVMQLWFAQVIALQNFLKSINQKYIFLNVWPFKYEQNMSHLFNNVDKRFYVGWPNYGMIDFMGDCPKGPGGHPLELGHQRIANTINEHIRNLGWFS